MTPQRRLPGILRRLRIPWVRDILWEIDHPESCGPRHAPAYGHPWESRNALTKWNPSCSCSTCKGERYSRKVKHPEEKDR